MLVSNWCQLLNKHDFSIWKMQKQQHSTNLFSFLKRMWTSLGNVMDWDCKIVDTKEIKELHPLIQTEDLVGGLYCPTDGSIDPTGFNTNFY